ncbi:hypothetical protein [Streptomyces sp. NPDC051994]|uniref:hypothetical protein n=1 Tax=unclassified Streptomyces TaxID=2593676 RepID=UPI0034379AB4
MNTLNLSLLTAAAAHEPMRRLRKEAAPLASDLYVDDSDYRARLIELHAKAADRRVEQHLLDEAKRYDKAHPGEPSLRDELLGTLYAAVA